MAAAAMTTLACATPEAGRRAFRPYDGARFLGNGICYGPHRDGQRPGGAAPSRAQLEEDLALMRGRWDLLRVYGADGPTPELLALLHEQGAPMKVLLGAWIAPEPAGEAENRAQVEAAVRLANAYPDVVLAVVVGNETQVSWSSYRTSPEVLLRWLAEARRGTALPVGTADDFKFWLEPESDRIVAQVDFLLTHAHPLWNGQRLDAALAWTQARHAEVVARHPGVPVVLGESGWATRKAPVGDQARLIQGQPGEEEQRVFFEAYTAWIVRERIPSTWFEAFDEAWKGSDHPDEVEKHWGLFRTDRTPKAAMKDGR